MSSELENMIDISIGAKYYKSGFLNPDVFRIGTIECFSEDSDLNTALLTFIIKADIRSQYVNLTGLDTVFIKYQAANIETEDKGLFDATNKRISNEKNILKLLSDFNVEHAYGLIASKKIKMTNNSKTLSKKFRIEDDGFEILNKILKFTSELTIFIIKTIDCNHNMFTSYENMLEENNITKNHNLIALSLFFQMLFTLNTFVKLGLKHNDLHLDNILITNESCDTSSEIKFYEYICGNKSIYLPNFGFNIKIIDFNFAIKNKTKLSDISCKNDFFDHICITDNNNPYFDLFHFLSQLVKFNFYANKGFKSFLNLSFWKNVFINDAINPYLKSSKKKIYHREETNDYLLFDKDSMKEILPSTSDMLDVESVMNMIGNKVDNEMKTFIKEKYKIKSEQLENYIKNNVEKVINY